jgi:hypothetical protein
MKRYAVVVISLLAVVGLFTAVSGRIRRGQAMEPRFNKRDFPKSGVQLITSADRNFDETASAYFKSPYGKSAEALKPFSVFIKNSSNRTIVAYILVWRLVKTNGEVLTNSNSYSEPGVLMGKRMPTDPRFKHTQAIEPNAARCFSWSGGIDEEGQGRIGGAPQSQLKDGQRSPETQAAIRSQLTAELSEASALTVSLDGVFFDDGTFIGPNTSGFFEKTQAIVNAKLDLLRDIVIAKENGQEDRALDAVDATSLQPDAVITSGSTAEEYYKYYKKLFATEISDTKKVQGKEGVAYIINLHKGSRPVLRKVLEEER